jgi:concanavalin A-like lectin/glucanase superfamily protein
MQMSGRLIIRRRRFLIGAVAALAAPAFIRSASAQGIGPGPGLPVAASLGLQTNLGSFFSLDNTLSDATGNVTDLTNNNSVTFVSSSPAPPAAVTNSAKFVGSSSQSLTHADATGLNIAGINASVQIWFYSTGNTISLLRKNSGGFGAREYGITYSFGTGPTNPVRVVTDDNNNINSSNTPINAWHHVVFTWNNTSKALVCYLDGTQFSSTTEVNVTAGTSNLVLGADAAGTGQFLTGNLCLFGTWRNRILSAADVTSLYNGGAGLSYAAMA